MKHNYNLARTGSMFFSVVAVAVLAIDTCASERLELSATSLRTVDKVIVQLAPGVLAPAASTAATALAVPPQAPEPESSPATPKRFSAGPERREMPSAASDAGGQQSRPDPKARNPEAESASNKAVPSALVSH